MNKVILFIYLFLCATTGAFLAAMAPLADLNRLNIHTLVPIDCSEGRMGRTVSIRTLVAQLQRSRPFTAAVIPVKAKVDRTAITSVGDQLDTGTVSSYLKVERGIPDNLSQGHIALYSRGGYSSQNMLERTLRENNTPAVGGGVLHTYTHIRDHFLPAVPSVSFDYCDQQFDFAQHHAQHDLDMVYRQIQQQHPAASIIIGADSVGGLNALRYIANNPQTTKNVVALVLESPIISVQEFFEKSADVYLKQYLGRFALSVMENFFTWYFPNFDKAEDNLLATAHHIKNKHILIGHLNPDRVVDNKSVNELVTLLRSNGNTVYLVIIDATDFEGPMPHHSRLAATTKMQRTVNTLYKKLAIPHNALLAYEGEALGLLEQAKIALA